ncbi:MerR family transcriptional regulator, partial [Candidatus Saccharibacteria bacterium]|nr:MerR family transcriptional regulator [Candidatus Saccharibacteria bacterium]
MRAISMRSAAKIAGVPYPTVATWIEQGLIRPQEYIGIQGNRVKLTAKDVNELCYLAKLRGLLSMQALKKALNYLRKLG